jgi:hypothetical protein
VAGRYQREREQANLRGLWSYDKRRIGASGADVEIRFAPRQECCGVPRTSSIYLASRKGSSSSATSSFDLATRKGSSTTSVQPSSISKESSSMQSSSMWKATTSVLSSGMWKVSTVIQSSCSLDDLAPRGSLSPMRQLPCLWNKSFVPGHQNATPSKSKHSDESADYIRMHVHFPEWVKRQAARHEKQFSLGIIQGGTQRKARDHEVHFPSEEVIRFSEVQARNEAHLQYQSLVKIGKCPVIPRNKFFYSE